MIEESILQIYTIIAVILGALLVYLLNRFKNSKTPIMSTVTKERLVNTGKRRSSGEEIWVTKKYTKKEYQELLKNTKNQYHKKMILYLIIYLLPIVLTILTVIIMFFIINIGIFFFILTIILTFLSEIAIKFYSSHFSGGYEY